MWQFFSCSVFFLFFIILVVVVRHSSSHSFVSSTDTRTFAKSETQQITTICANGFFSGNEIQQNETKNKYVSLSNKWRIETRITIWRTREKNQWQAKTKVAKQTKNNNNGSTSNNNNNNSYNNTHQQYEYLWLNVAIEILDQIALDIVCCDVRAYGMKCMYVCCWNELLMNELWMHDVFNITAAHCLCMHWDTHNVLIANFSMHWIVSAIHLSDND